MQDFENLQHEIFYIVKPNVFYDSFTYDIIQRPICSVFAFSEEVFHNALRFFDYKQSFEVMHLRLGDKHLETDSKYVLVKHDSRHYDSNVMENYMSRLSSEGKHLFFCDNRSFKQKMKTKYPTITILSTDIGHTSFQNTSRQQVLDGISEFCIMCHSNQIVAFSLSGFSKIASMWKPIRYTLLA
jgi:hypothetical protein